VRILVGCEFSGTVRDAFRRLGHDAVSCDLIASDLPGRHIQGHIEKALGEGWDMLIAFPPCTHLCVSGARHFAKKKVEQRDAIAFVDLLWDAPIPRIAIENPVGVLSTRFLQPDQIIQPWQFGHGESKTTCLWLKNLPPLTPTAHVDPDYLCSCGYRFDSSLGRYGCANCGGEGRIIKRLYGNQTNSGQNRVSPSPDRWKLRSQTYQGIANAMAAQWGAL